MQYPRSLILLISLLALGLGGCDDDDNDAGSEGPRFVTEVHVENTAGERVDSLPIGQDAVVVLTVRNRSTEAQSLTSSDARTRDFVVLDDAEEAVRVWSTRHGFDQAVREVEFEPLETRRFDMEWEGLLDDDGQPLPVGQYEIQGWLSVEEEDGIDDLSPGQFRSTLQPFAIEG
ncbi:BsuPI-related putative proteinase inhibitor [Gammaproteobacteria bacterium AB-CW1]|uniref:Intracellular proteinase inhibitor BsuPI domain-containing protein n=1 Tax=Natronospira elongata TaxID=3110268 RepID=A0AAP6JDN9_9GAMM|nr:BsuPI-related putative proteinase inhibitor [Gammaproteobacteria bacterium AB-CW1]